MRSHILRNTIERQKRAAEFAALARTLMEAAILWERAANEATCERVQEMYKHHAQLARESASRFQRIAASAGRYARMNVKRVVRQ